MLWRTRVTSFLAGVAIAGSLALYQLRQDLWDSHAILAAQVWNSSVRDRGVKLDSGTLLVPLCHFGFVSTR